MPTFHLFFFCVSCRELVDFITDAKSTILKIENKVYGIYCIVNFYVRLFCRFLSLLLFVLVLLDVCMHRCLGMIFFCYVWWVLVCARVRLVVMCACGKYVCMYVRMYVCVCVCVYACCMRMYVCI